MKSDRLEPLLVEQINYYRAVADEYEDHAISPVGAEEVIAALEAFRPAGDVLELACGPGMWTKRLLRFASQVTAVDAAPEMLARARGRVGDDRVRFLQADLFSWKPDRQYDVVFFGFWISHVPLEQFDAFWMRIAESVTSEGRVFFVDDNYRTADELIEGEASSTILRRLNNGTSYRIVKVAYSAQDLEGRLGRLGWNVRVTQTSGPFYWGEGRRGA